MDATLYIMQPVFATLTIIGIAIAIYFALRFVNKTFPQIAQKIMNATPWMGWSEPESTLFQAPTNTRPSNRW